MPDWIIDVWWHLVWGNVAKSFSCSEEQRNSSFFIQILVQVFSFFFPRLNKYVNLPVT